MTQPIVETGNFSLWLDLKPVTNTGGMQATTDGGATWEALDLSDVRYDRWSRASLPMRAVAAGALIGLRIPNAGDAFGIDFVQLSTVDYETSPIQTTTGRHEGLVVDPCRHSRQRAVGAGLQRGAVMSGLRERWLFLTIFSCQS